MARHNIRNFIALAGVSALANTSFGQTGANICVTSSATGNTGCGRRCWRLTRQEFSTRLSGTMLSQTIRPARKIPPSVHLRSSAT